MSDEFDSIAAGIVSAHIASEAAALSADDAPTEVAPAAVEAAQAEGDDKPAEVKTEAPPAVEAKPEAPKVDWKAVAAADKERRAARHAAKEKASAVANENAALKARIAKLDAFEAKKASDPLAALEDVGLSYSDLTTKYIQSLERQKLDGKPITPEEPPEIKALRADVAAMKAKLEADQEAVAKQQDAANYTAVMAKIEEVATAEDCELVKTLPDGKAKVYQIMAEYYSETGGQHLDFAVAAKAAEQALEEERLTPILQTKKAQAKIAALAPAKKSEPAATLTGDLKKPSSAGTPKADLDEMLTIFNRLQSQEAQD